MNGQTDWFPASAPSAPCLYTLHLPSGAVVIRLSGDKSTGYRQMHGPCVKLLFEVDRGYGAECFFDTFWKVTQSPDGLIWI
jgi:hypothetical protein